MARVRYICNVIMLYKVYHFKILINTFSMRTIINAKTMPNARIDKTKVIFFRLIALKSDILPTPQWTLKAKKF